MKQALRDALDDRGYQSLTPVQEAVLDNALVGRDLLVSAQTGSGKTLGFGLAIAPTILGEDEAFGAAGAPLALVIAPTRELAMQVKRELSWVYAKAGAVVASCVGGMDMRDERRALARGAHIVAATPGRLRDHIMRGSIDLTNVRAVVLDEADEMLDLGFREELEFILGEAPDDRQTLLFSATVPAAIATLAKRYQKDAARIVAKSEKPQHADIEYRAMLVADRDVEHAVINTLRLYDAPNALVFANTRAMVTRLTTRLSNRGFKAVALSGELSQTERTHALQAMRDGRAQVCVATDVAARGIDLPKLDLVIHAELPTNQETLLHRSGRTGRAGRKGVSAMIVTPKTRKKAERLLGWAKLQAHWGGAPSAEEVIAQDEERLFADPIWSEPVTEAERAGVDKLLSSFSAEQIATVFLRLVASTRSAPEELSDVNAKPAPRTAFGPSVWFSVTGGRDAGAEPRRLLPMLCKAGNLSKDDIGAIRVQKDQSYVEILETSVPTFLKAVGSDMTLEEGAVVTQLATAPDLGRTERGSPKGPARPKRAQPAPRPERTDPPTDVAPEAAPRKSKPKKHAKPKANTHAPASDGERKKHGKPGRKPGKSPKAQKSDGQAKPKGKPARKPFPKPTANKGKRPKTG